MQLEFPIHFKEKIVERDDIDVDHIKQVIRNPDYQVLQLGNRIIARKEINGRTLKVVYARGNSKNKFVIITAYYLGKQS
jgi:hypothetical protein